MAVSLVIRLCICWDCQRSGAKSQHWEVDDRFCVLVHSRVCHDVGSVRKFIMFFRDFVGLIRFYDFQRYLDSDRRDISDKDEGQARCLGDR